MNNGNPRIKPEFWRDIIVNNCKICGGTGVQMLNENASSIALCKCSRMVRLFVKMNDPEHGLHPKYHKWTLSNATDLSVSTKKKIKEYLKTVETKNPFRNLIIKGGKNSGKSSVASIVYKFLMTREYEVSMVRFSEIVALSRFFIANSKEFSDRKDLYDLLRDEQFLIIEDVDNRGHSDSTNFEKLGYGLLDEVFSYRANHPRRATIITVDSDLNITPSTLGRSFYYSIYTSDVEDNKICELELDKKR